MAKRARCAVPRKLQRRRQRRRPTTVAANMPILPQKRCLGRLLSGVERDTRMHEHTRTNSVFTLVPTHAHTHTRKRKYTHTLLCAQPSAQPSTSSASSMSGGAGGSAQRSSNASNSRRPPSASSSPPSSASRQQQPMRSKDVNGVTQRILRSFRRNNPADVLLSFVPPVLRPFLFFLCYCGGLLPCC